MIRVEVGELVEVEAEAILRPVSTELLAVTGPGREVDRRAGADVADRLRRFGALPIGGALVTPGGELHSAFLIHVVVQSAEEPVTEAGVRRALLNGLRRASEWGIESLSLPPLGTGAGNFEAEASARIMIPLLREHMRDNERPASVVVCVANEYEEEVFRGALSRAAEAPATADEPEEVPEARS